MTIIIVALAKLRGKIKANIRSSAYKEPLAFVQLFSAMSKGDREKRVAKERNDKQCEE